MCGICGIISLTGTPVKEELIHKMCSTMIHRGPDDEGVYIRSDFNLSVGIGHRRLKIIDLSEAGHQPMVNEDGTLHLVINGEIYNYQTLRKELIEKGHQFRSNTDSEVVLHLYEDIGEDCISFLQGMFAFAIWDEKQNKLFFARDRLGQKPFLYYYDNKYFCFASEFSALLASGLIKKDINYEAIDQYLTFGYVPAPATIYKNVYKILPAHFGILQNGKLHLQKYWELKYYPKIYISEEEAAQEVIRLLKKAVKSRLVSDVPLGVFLSGGIDSSAVTALMSQLTNKVRTFSIGFDIAEFDELKYARNISKHLSTDHHEFLVEPKALEILPLLVERYGEPYADSSAIPTYYVSRETRGHVTVALNGDGGDESFAGYERYQAMFLAEYYNKLPNFFRNGFRHAILHLVQDSINFKNKRRRLRRFIENVSMPFYKRYCRWVCMINEDEKNKLYQKSFKEQLNSYNPAEWLKEYPCLPSDMNLTDRLMAIDIKTNLANDLLVKMDIASMANSLETRSPFLDHELMEFAAKLPAEYKMKRLVKKYILKKAIKNLVPQENIHRGKMGFGIPVGDWFRNDLKDFLYETLLSQSSFNRGYFKPAIIKDMVKKHGEKQIDYTFQLWTLLMLELWHQKFIS